MNVKLLALDVDGVMTDAGMYYTESGDEFKKFNTRDGMGIQMVREAGLKVAIITSEQTKIVERRAAKLKIDFLFQGVHDKLATLTALCGKIGISLAEVAYIGDDINDLAVLQVVGHKACPCDAVDTIRKIQGITILTTKGGGGAVREFIEILGIPKIA